MFVEYERKKIQSGLQEQRIQPKNLKCEINFFVYND